MINICYHETTAVFAQLTDKDEEMVRDYAKEHDCTLEYAINELVAQNEIEPWDYQTDEELEDMSEIEIVEEK